MLKQCLENIGEGLLHACISSISDKDRLRMDPKQMRSDATHLIYPIYLCKNSLSDWFRAGQFFFKFTCLSSNSPALRVNNNGGQDLADKPKF